MENKSQNILKIHSKLVESILNQTKTATIRQGFRDYQPGPGLFIVDGTESTQLKINILRVDWLKIKNISQEMLKLEGYPNLKDLIHALSQYYPNINMESDVTFVEFALLESNPDK